jgi:hypothetical protein
LAVLGLKSPMLFHHLKPATPKNWLIATAGLLWSTVGVMLCSIAFHWMVSLLIGRMILLVSAGVLGAIVAYRFTFSSIAQKNIIRLLQFPEKVCFFAFQAWKSYFIIIVMILLGATLRHSSIPKHYLAVVYLTIGGALFLSSLHYYKTLWDRCRSHKT